jgi:hypothetical protein
MYQSRIGLPRSRPNGRYRVMPIASRLPRSIFSIGPGDVDQTQGTRRPGSVRYFSMNAQDRAKLEAEYKERDKDRAQKTDALVKQIFAAEDEIKRCLLSVT